MNKRPSLALLFVAALGIGGTVLAAPEPEPQMTPEQLTPEQVLDSMFIQFSMYNPDEQVLCKIMVNRVTQAHSMSCFPYHVEEEPTPGHDNAPQQRAEEQPRLPMIPAADFGKHGKLRT